MRWELQFLSLLLINISIIVLYFLGVTTCIRFAASLFLLFPAATVGELKYADFTLIFFFSKIWVMNWNFIGLTIVDRKKYKFNVNKIIPHRFLNSRSFNSDRIFLRVYIICLMLYTAIKKLFFFHHILSKYCNKYLRAMQSECL